MTPEEIQVRQETLNDLREMVTFLEEHPEVPISSHLTEPKVWFWGYTADRDKNSFLAAAKALGNFEKKVDGNDFLLIKTFGSVQFTLSINRSEVCTARTEIKEVPVTVWDCPPLLVNGKPIEEAVISQEAAVS